MMASSVVEKNSNEWHRSEPRLVRPFFGLMDVSEVLNKAKICLFDPAPPAEETEFLLDEIDLPRLKPVVFPELPAIETWLPDGFASSDFQLSIIVSNPLLKNSVLLEQHSFGSPAPRTIAVPEEVLTELGSGRNLEISLAISLAYDRQPRPGSPFLQGHWLAKKQFSIKSKNNPSFFDIQPRTDDEWVLRGFPAKTLYYVEYLGGIAESSEPNSSIATVWVHADAYNVMASTPTGNLLQPILAAELIAQILEASAEEWKGLPEVPPQSPLATVLKRLAPYTFAELKSLGGGKLRAILHDQLGAVRAVVEK